MFCEVILPLHLPRTFTYRIPTDLQGQVKIGCRVAVQFGNKRIYSALVAELHNRVPRVQSVKFILELIDREAVISQENLSFWQWIADYYACYIGDVMLAGLPAAFRLKSETKLLVSPDFTGDTTGFSDKEISILKFVAAKKNTDIDKIAAHIGDIRILPLITGLMERQVLIADEQLYDRYSPKTEDYLVFGEECRGKEQLQCRIKELESRKNCASQLETLMRFIVAEQKSGIVKRSDFQRENSPSSIQSLIRKGILSIERSACSRLAGNLEIADSEAIILNDEQSEAYNRITQSWNTKNVSLLHGVTGSGKTEVYIKLIARMLEEGKQVLYLLPEIALTAHLINRLEKYFGKKAGVYHSRFSKDERVEIWQKVKSEDMAESYRIIIGSRSSIFLPFSNLGLVIVDEEHDSGFKQTEPAPRYNAKDAALYLAQTAGVKVVLGSATPSVESFFNAQTERFAYAKLTKPYADYKLPEILLADLRQDYRQHSMYSIFSELLYKNMEHTLQKGRQVILFRNLRGFASSLRCDVCGWTAKCPNCDVSLTVHNHGDMLNCHYCGVSLPIVSECPQCGSRAVRMTGSGSEKLEEEAQRYFPNATVARMDADSIRNKGAYQKIIDDFGNGKTDILCGTQLVSKGFDFANVGLVGIIDADSMLNYPDFRSYERCFSLLTQLAGRAGRSKEKGRVIIQTFNPLHPVFKDVGAYNYEAMYNKQIVERKLFRYPPFYHLLRISLQCRDCKELDSFADTYTEKLRGIFGGRILGPEYPPVSRIRSFYIKNIILKLERKLSYAKAKQAILRLNEEMYASVSKNHIRIITDVDPQ